MLPTPSRVVAPECAFSLTRRAARAAFGVTRPNCMRHSLEHGCLFSPKRRATASGSSSLGIFGACQWALKMGRLPSVRHKPARRSVCADNAICLGPAQLRNISCVRLPVCMQTLAGVGIVHAYTLLGLNFVRLRTGRESSGDGKLCACACCVRLLHHVTVDEQTRRALAPSRRSGGCSNPPTGPARANTALCSKREAPYTRAAWAGRCGTRYHSPASKLLQTSKFSFRSGAFLGLGSQGCTES